MPSCLLDVHSIVTAPNTEHQNMWCFDTQVLSFLVRYIVESNDESMALLGVSLLQQLVQAAATEADDKGWDCIISAFQSSCSFNTLESLLSDPPARSDNRLFVHCLLTSFSLVLCWSWSLCLSSRPVLHHHVKGQ